MPKKRFRDDEEAAIPYIPADTLSRMRVDAGLYYDSEEQELFACTAYESGQVGAETWNQHYVTSKGKQYWYHEEDSVLIEEHQDGTLVGVRRAHKSFLVGLHGKDRISRKGFVRVLEQEPVRRDFAASLILRLKECVVLPEEWHYSLVATWIAYTYLYVLFPVSPFLVVTSTRMGSGKTSLLNFLEYTALNAQMSSTMTAAAVVRSSSYVGGTLILDEMEFLGKPGCTESDINQLLNAKHSANAARITNVPARGIGWVPTPMKMYGPLRVFDS